MNSPESSEGSVFCGACGTRFDAGVRFCPSCGGRQVPFDEESSIEAVSGSAGDDAIQIQSAPTEALPMSAASVGAKDATSQSEDSAPATDPVGPRPGRALFCAGCGRRFDQDARFCEQCGAGRGHGAPEPDAGGAGAQPRQALPHGWPSTRPEAKKKGLLSRIVFVPWIAALLLLISVGSILFGRSIIGPIEIALLGVIGIVIMLFVKLVGHKTPDGDRDNAYSQPLHPEAKEQHATGIVIVGYICAVLLPIVGAIIGATQVNRNRHGIWIIWVSIAMVVVGIILYVVLLAAINSSIGDYTEY